MNSSFWSLAICLRARVVSIVVLENDHIREVEQVQVRPARREEKLQRVARIVRRLIANYRITTIVSDGSELLRPCVDISDTHVEVMQLDEAKNIVLQSPKATHRELFNFTVRRNGELQRFVIILKTGEVATWDRARTVVLLAAALGVAAHLKRTTIICNN